MNACADGSMGEEQEFEGEGEWKWDHAISLSAVESHQEALISCGGILSGKENVRNLKANEHYSSLLI